jgi:hypothetical protein
MAVAAPQQINLNDLLKTINTSYNNADSYYDYEDFGDDVNTVTIKITPANGGTIVNIDPESGSRGRGDLYVIDSAKDLGSELGQILTMHYLKKGANESPSKARR